MTTSRSVLIISTIALILLAMIPAVSAIEVIYDRDLYEFIDTSKSGEVRGDGPLIQVSVPIDRICFTDITKAQKLNYLVFEIPGNRGEWDNGTKIKEGRHDFTYNFNGA